VSGLVEIIELLELEGGSEELILLDELEEGTFTP
jgi:hypothetical protein